MVLNRFVWYIARALLLLVLNVSGVVAYLYTLGTLYPHFDGSGNSVGLFIVLPIGIIMSAISAGVLFFFRHVVLPECPACKGIARQIDINSLAFECTQCDWGKGD